MSDVKFFEATVEFVEGQTRSGKDKKRKEVYLVDSQSCTEAEARVVQDFTDAGINVDYKVVQVKESRIIRVIETN